MMDEESEAFRHWRDIVSSPPDDGAIRAGIDYALANIAEGRIFRPGEADLAGDLEGYAEFGLAAPLRRFWPKLTELVGGNDPLARRMAELRDRVLIVELALDGFAAGTRPFPDDSHLVQIDTGLFLTVFEVVQAFVEVCDPDPEVPPGQAERESAVVLELLLAEYRLLHRNASSKPRPPTPDHGRKIGELTQAANVFVLAHELSHILLGHAGARDDDQRQYDEATADVLAFRILSGTYAAEPNIERAQAYGRLLGARLLFSCIELFEHATFVTGSRTHPPATDRWAVVRAAAEETFGPLIPDGVDELWQPMDRLLVGVAAGDLPIIEVRASLESLKARTRFLGDVETEEATGLIARHRRTASRG
jgi:hypothetical protein